MDIDYEKSGLKCGLEIHQQLNTGKLFCNCPGILRSEEPDFVIYRKLHAVAGEGGEVDVAASYQAGLDKEFVYQGYDTTCLVELDEEPPHEINKQALEIALQISLLLNCKVIPLTQIMRKTVIDGSNTSGFQRTVLIAQDGYVETEKGKVRIESICLEEDSARIVERGKDQIVYRLDRLGIPLVEITTAPDIKSPEQAKEVALHIGEVLRSCNVKRGIGTIRQDVNVSTKKHPRVEIKGFQDIRNIEIAVKKEIERQQNSKEKNSEVRRVLADGTSEFLRPMPGSARMYPETDLPFLRISRDFINKAKKTLPKLKHEVKGDLKEKGLHEEMIKLLLKQNKIEEFKELLNILDKPNLIVKMLVVFPREIMIKEKISKERVEERLNRDVLIFVLEELKKEKISENQIKQVMERVAHGTKVQDAVLFKKQDLHSVEERIAKLIKEKPGLSQKAYMGLIMKEFRGAVSGKEVMEMIKKQLEN